MTNSTIAAAVLAGGRARRFDGRDKSRLIVEGRPIIVRQLELLQRLTSEVFVVSSDRERFSDLHVPVHPDRVPGLGAIGGIQTALEVATAEHVIVIACDLPFLQCELLQTLVERSHDSDGAWVRTSQGVEPLIACYRKHASPTVSAAIKAGRLKAADLGSVLRMSEIGSDELAQFGSAARLVTNINTPDDYARVQ